MFQLERSNLEDRTYYVNYNIDKNLLCIDRLSIKGKDMRSPSLDHQTTNFGFQKVPMESKRGLVRDVFNSVSPKYDLMNDLMSFGIHRLWKTALLDWLTPHPKKVLLDVAGGTGDIANRYLIRGGGPVFVCDINQTMLNVGKKKLEQNSYTHKIQWICGDAEALPIPERSIDVYTIAFGLRNVTSITNALSEARRVLRPGGRFMCLEFSKPAVNLLKPFYDAYSFKVLPEIGHLVANDRNAYKYLAESIRQFPDQSKLQGQIENAGLEQVRYRNLSGGIACIHSAWRI